MCHTSLSLALSILLFSHFCWYLQYGDGLLVEMTGVIGVVDFICKFLPSPFELFHNDIAMRLYSTCNDGLEWEG